MDKIFCQQWKSLYEHWQSNRGRAFERALTNLQHDIRAGKFEGIDAQISYVVLSLEIRDASLATILDTLNQSIDIHCREPTIRRVDGSNTPFNPDPGNWRIIPQAPKGDQYL